ncbi:MAG: hypothetical protein GEV03_15965 [Streptosporangiales bacterium]|nr:hypothetical protein [Streptosporangiales bacterium]
MIVLLSAVSLVLAIAIVVLFAMMGELASRIPEPGPRRTWMEPIKDVQLGRIPESWPPELAQVPERDHSVVLVLSTVCSSCRAHGAELENHTDWAEAALVVSTPVAANAEAFVAEFGLGSFPHYVDEGGDWVRAEFEVASSPVALVLRSGRLVGAYSFSDLDTLRSRLHEQLDRIEDSRADAEKEVETV